MRVTVSLQVDDCTSITKTVEVKGYTDDALTAAAGCALSVIRREAHIWNVFHRPELRGGLGSCGTCKHEYHVGFECGKELIVDDSTKAFCACRGTTRNVASS